MLGRLGNPSPRVERLFNSLTAGCPRPRAGPAPLGQDGEAGPRAGCYRPGQPRRQPDASGTNGVRRTLTPLGPGPLEREVGPTRAGRWPVIALAQLCWTPVTRRDAHHPRGTTLERLSGWIRTTGGQPVTQGPRQPLPEYFEPGGRRLGWEPLGRSTLGMARPGWHQAVSVDLPAGQASGEPGHGWVPPELRDVRPTRGTLQPARAPGRQVLQDAQSVAITVTEHRQSTSESDGLVPKRPPLPPVKFHPRKMILTAEDLFLQGPYLLLTARKTCQETLAQTWALLCKHCIFPNFEIWQNLSTVYAARFELAPAPTTPSACALL